MEIMLTKYPFGWSLHEIDETEIESLFEFVFYYFQRQSQAGGVDHPAQKYADQVGWL